MTTPATAFASFQPALMAWATSQMPMWLRGKLDPTDLVQQTLLEALRAVDKLAERPDHEVLAYLRRALTNNLKDALRKFDHQKTDLSPAAYFESSVRLLEFLAADDTTPSERAARNERYQRLAGAIADLPDQQRLAVEMRYLQGMKVVDIAQILDRTEGAVSLLLHRAITALRGVLPQEPE